MTQIELLEMKIVISEIKNTGWEGNVDETIVQLEVMATNSIQHGTQKRSYKKLRALVSCGTTSFVLKYINWVHASDGELQKYIKK